MLRLLLTLEFSEKFGVHHTECLRCSKVSVRYTHFSLSCISSIIYCKSCIFRFSRRLIFCSFACLECQRRYGTLKAFGVIALNKENIKYLFAYNTASYTRPRLLLSLSALKI